MTHPAPPTRPQHILVCDAGTSRVKLALFEENSFLTAPLSLERIDFPGQVTQVQQWLREWPTPFQACVLASGPSDDVPVIRQALHEIAGCTCDILERTSPLPYLSHYAAGQAGIDRLANVAAAFSAGRFPAIVVDAGTAITLEVLNAEGEFLGGAILPGPALQAQALHRATTSLPYVQLGSGPPAIGSDTDEAISAGLLHGSAGAVERLLRLSQEQTGSAVITITGGWGQSLSELLQMHEAYDPEFTLRGILSLWGHGQAEQPSAIG